MNNLIVTEESVQKALDFLRDNADEIGRLTQDARFAEAWVKVVLATVMKTVEGPVSGQEREARASSEYKLAIAEEAKTAGELAKAKALREAAAMRIEVWRSEQANYRSMKL